MIPETSENGGLSPLNADGNLNVFIETPKGSRNKYTYEPGLNRYKLKSVLPLGHSFPFDFGFLPGTLGGDGDPLDVLVLMDEPAFTGCLVPARLIGVIEAEQTEKNGKVTRNDRLLAVSEASYVHKHIHSLADISDHLLEEIEHFFISYNTFKDKKFRVIKRSAPKKALQLIKAGAENFKKS